MSDSTTTPQEGATTTPQGEGTTATAQAVAGAENPPAGDSQQFTQQRFNDLLAREKHELKAKFEARYADYEDLKTKAAQLDALEEAKKTELEKAQDATAKAQDEAKSWKAKYEELAEQVERRKAIDAAAAEYKVDAAMLARMTGDVEENARFLAEKDANAPKYPNVSDGGESSSQGMTEDEIDAIKNPAERIKARAEYIKSHS